MVRIERWGGGLSMMCKRNFRLAAALLCLAAAWTAPARASEAAADGPIEVFAGIPPVAYIVERIGGEYVTVNVMVREGQEPHTFEPAPRQMMNLAGARIYFKVGMPFEARLVEKVTGGGARLKVVDISEGVPKVAIDAHGAEGPASHAHGDAGGGADLDPHIWLSPPLVKIQAENIRDALIEIDPGHADEYRANCADLAADLETVHESVRGMLEPFEGRAIYVFHPAFGYFADAYGLRQVAVETGGKSPTPRTLAKLIDEARADGVKAIFVQPQFDAKSAEAVAVAIGGDLVTLNDLPRDVLSNFMDMAAKIQKALESAGETGGAE